MCNRYENRGSVSHIRAIVREINRILSTTSATDNLAPQDDIYPDQDAPILRNAPDGSVELTMVRWGFPPIPGQKSPITNIRNLKSEWWSQVNREWLTAREYRCLVPFTAFAEPVVNSKWFVVQRCRSPRARKSDAGYSCRSCRADRVAWRRCSELAPATPAAERHAHHPNRRRSAGHVRGTFRNSTDLTLFIR